MGGQRSLEQHPRSSRGLGLPAGPRLPSAAMACSNALRTAALSRAERVQSSRPTARECRRLTAAGTLNAPAQPVDGQSISSARRSPSPPAPPMPKPWKTPRDQHVVMPYASAAPAALAFGEILRIGPDRSPIRTSPGRPEWSRATRRIQPAPHRIAGVVEQHHPRARGTAARTCPRTSVVFVRRQHRSAPTFGASKG